MATVRVRARMCVSVCLRIIFGVSQLYVYVGLCSSSVADDGFSCLCLAWRQVVKSLIAWLSTFTQWCQPGTLREAAIPVFHWVSSLHSRLTTSG